MVVWERILVSELPEPFTLSTRMIMTHMSRVRVVPAEPRISWMPRDRDREAEDQEGGELLGGTSRRAF